jgi:hypothetical protein
MACQEPGGGHPVWSQKGNATNGVILGAPDLNPLPIVTPQTTAEKSHKMAAFGAIPLNQQKNTGAEGFMIPSRFLGEGEGKRNGPITPG